MKKLINLSLLLFTIHLSLIISSAQTEQKAELIVQTGHLSRINKIVFSSDDKFFVTSDDNEIILWESKNGLQLGKFSSPTENAYFESLSVDDYFRAIESLAFSADGKKLVVITKIAKIEAENEMNDYFIQEFNVENYSEIHPSIKLEVGNSINCIELEKNGLNVGFSIQNETKWFDTATGAKIKKDVQIKCFSNETDSMKTISENEKILRKNNIPLFDDEFLYPLLVVSSNNGEYMVIGFGNLSFRIDAQESLIKIWNLNKREEINTISNSYRHISSVDVAKNGKFFAFSQGWGTAQIYDIQTSKFRVCPIGKANDEGNGDNSDKDRDSERITDIKISPDNNTVAIAGWYSVIYLWKLSDDSVKIINTSYNIDRISFSPNGDKIVYGGNVADNISSIDLKTQKETTISKPFPKWILKSFSEEITNNLSEKHKISDEFALEISSAEITIVKSNNVVVASIFPVNEKDWVVTTSDGLFDATNSGRELVHYALGLEPISLEQMKDLYYVPGLLQKIFKGEPLPKVELFSKKDLFPDVEFSQPAAGQKDLAIKLTNRGGGIGQVQVLVNGKEFVKDARPVGFDVNAKQTVTLNVSLKDAPFIAGGENKMYS